MKPPAAPDQPGDAGAGLRVALSGWGSSARVIVTRAPPGRFSAVAAPPCARATARTMASPRPARVRRDVTAPRTNASNALGSRPSPKPGPVFSVLSVADLTRYGRLDPDQAAALRTVADGVVQQVVESLADPHGIDRDLYRGSGPLDPRPPVLGPRLVARAGPAEQILQGGAHPVDAETARPCPGQHQQVLGQPGQPVGLLRRAPQGHFELPGSRGRDKVRSSSAFRMLSGVRSS